MPSARLPPTSPSTRSRSSGVSLGRATSRSTSSSAASATRTSTPRAASGGRESGRSSRGTRSSAGSAPVGGEVEGFTVGDLAGVGCMVDSCRTCASCGEGLEQYCENGTTFTYGGKEKETGRMTDGRLLERDRRRPGLRPAHLPPMSTSPPPRRSSAPGSPPTHRSATGARPGLEGRRGRARRPRPHGGEDRHRDGRRGDPVHHLAGQGRRRAGARRERGRRLHRGRPDEGRARDPRPDRRHGRRPARPRPPTSPLLRARRLAGPARRAAGRRTRRRRSRLVRRPPLDRRLQHRRHRRDPGDARLLRRARHRHRHRDDPDGRSTRPTSGCCVRRQVPVRHRHGSRCPRPYRAGRRPSPRRSPRRRCRGRRSSGRGRSPRRSAGPAPSCP